MKLEQLIRGLLLVGVWIAIALILIVAAVVLALAGAGLPSVALWVAFSIGIALTILIASPWGWQIIGAERMAHIQRQINEQVSQLNDAELLEVMAGLDEVKDRFGLEIPLPDKRKHSKQQQLDTAIRNLSDTELLYLKDRLRDGEIDEDKLMAWLNDVSDEQQEN